MRAERVVRHQLLCDLFRERGIETAAHFEFLRSTRCDEFQGYYLCKPVPAAAFAQMLRSQQMREERISAFA